MHKCHKREKDEPCNAYCHADVHVGLLYGTPTMVAQKTPEELLVYARNDHQWNDGCATCTFLTLTPASEAPSWRQRYPHMPGTARHTVAFLLTCTIGEKTGDNSCI